MNRKEFLQVSLAGAAAVAATSAPMDLFAAPKKGKTELKLSFQEGIAPGKSLEEKLDYMENLGIVGFEPSGRNLAARVNEIQQALRGRNIKVSAICAGFSGFILAEDPKVKAEFDSTLRVLLWCPLSMARSLASLTPLRLVSICASRCTSWVSLLLSTTQPLSWSL